MEDGQTAAMEMMGTGETMETEPREANAEGMRLFIYEACGRLLGSDAATEAEEEEEEEERSESGFNLKELEEYHAALPSVRPVL